MDPALLQKRWLHTEKMEQIHDVCAFLSRLFGWILEPALATHPHINADESLIPPIKQQQMKRFPPPSVLAVTPKSCRPHLFPKKSPVPLVKVPLLHVNQQQLEITQLKSGKWERERRKKERKRKNKSSYSHRCLSVSTTLKMKSWGFLNNKSRNKPGFTVLLWVRLCPPHAASPQNLWGCVITTTWTPWACQSADPGDGGGGSF